MPYKVYKTPSGKFKVYKLDAEHKRVGSGHGEHDTRASALAQLRALYAAESEMTDDERDLLALEDDAYPVDEIEDDAPVSEQARETVRELTAVSAFEGTYPNIPADGVDMNALTEGDVNPVFVTLPILEIGRVSKNGLLYDKALVESVVEQINAKKSGGIFGHIPDEDRSTSFPIPNALWIGARLVGNVAYGKAYIRDRATAEYIRHLKAVGGKIGTSIYGSGVTETTDDGARRLTKFVLESLDFAPPERASLTMSGEFAITREMAQGENHMTIDELKSALGGMSADDLVSLLGDETVMQVAEQYAKKSKKKMVAMEMVREMDDSATTISEQTAQISRLERENAGMSERIAEYENREFNIGLDTLVASKIDWKTATAEHEAQVAALRKQLRREVVRELAGKRDLTLANAKADVIMESDEFRPIAEAMRNALAGGAAVTGGKGKNWRDKAVESAEDLRKEWGL